MAPRVVLLPLLLSVAGCFAAPPPQLKGPVPIEDADPMPESRPGWEVEQEKSSCDTWLLYLPNRLLDLLDVGRARLRLGVGFAVGGRATRAVEMYIGDYDSYWLGLHGPRGRPEIPWPGGTERRSGAQFLFLGTSSGGPEYGLGELGLDAQLIIIGANVGLDVWEAVDFLVGIFGYDPVGDDY